MLSLESSRAVSSVPAFNTSAALLELHLPLSSGVYSSSSHRFPQTWDHQCIIARPSPGDLLPCYRGRSDIHVVL